MDYRKINAGTEKDHFPVTFMDQILDRHARKDYYCFLDNQISLAPEDLEKLTFTCQYRTFASKQKPFVLCSNLATFKRCMMFFDMVEETIEILMDNFSIVSNSFNDCLSYLTSVLKRCEDINLVLNWEKLPLHG